MHATASQKLVPRTATTQTRRSAFPPRATGPRSTVEISPLHSQCQGHSVIVDVESVRNHLSANATYRDLTAVVRYGHRAEYRDSTSMKHQGAPVPSQRTTQWS